LKLDINGIHSRQPAALRQLLTAVKRSAHIACLKLGAESWEEDVAQEVYMLFIEKLIHRFDQAYNAEPYLIEISRFTAMTWMRRNNKEISFAEIFGPNHDETSLLNETQNDINVSNRKIFSGNLLDSENPVDGIDQRKSLELAKTMLTRKIQRTNNRVLPNLQSPSLSLSSEKKLEGGDASTFIRQTNAKRIELGEHAMRLSEIRQNLGCSLEKFASLLQISNARLSTYIYGRNQFLPDKRASHREIMQRAEDLAERGKDLIDDYKKFEKHSMKEWIQKWAKQIGVKPEEHVPISEVARVHPTTVWRWVKGEMTPPLHEMRILVRYFDEAEKKLKKPKKTVKA
jgi:DNA-directed RNA polymerase specialized sigma24 family protein/predicted transcriptional regulator